MTELLQAWSSGSRAALDELVPLIHDDLRRLVRQRLQSMGPGPRCKPPHWLTRPRMVRKCQTVLPVSTHFRDCHLVDSL